MALQKEIELPTGVSATYHRILAIHFFRKMQIPATPQQPVLVNSTLIEVGSYLSHEIALADKQPLTVSSLVIEGEVLSRSAAYTHLKDTSEFSGAEDV